jgi:hypothetical protein
VKTVSGENSDTAAGAFLFLIGARSSVDSVPPANDPDNDPVGTCSAAAFARRIAGTAKDWAVSARLKRHCRRLPAT